MVDIRLKMNRMIQLINKKQEIISYLFWGFMTTIVSWGSYSLFVYLGRNNQAKILNMSANILLSNIASWICAMTFAFISNKLWVFKSKSWCIAVFLPECWKFVSARLATGIMEMIAVPLAVRLGVHQSLFGIEGGVSKFCVSVLVVILNYFFSKLIIFKNITTDC